MSVRFRFAALAGLALGFAVAPTMPQGRAAEAPAVVATILPLHSLVAGVMDGVATPQLLLPAGASPHAYALRPSDARALSRAKVVFWIGEALENFLERPLATLAKGARVVEVLDMDGVAKLAVREGGVWAAHEDAHGHARDAHGHGHAGLDAHVWLDPANARAIVRAAAAALAAADPANGARYAANARALEGRLDALETRIAARLAPVSGRAYIVFHDAYQYFERRYGLTPAGSVTVSPGRPPGARRLAELRAKIRGAGAACVFIEPQFEPRLAHTVIEGTGARLGTLDPVGAGLAPGKDAYFTLMETLADSLARCLVPPAP